MPINVRTLSSHVRKAQTDSQQWSKCAERCVSPSIGYKLGGTGLSGHLWQTGMRQTAAGPGPQRGTGRPAATQHFNVIAKKCSYRHARPPPGQGMTKRYQDAASPKTAGDTPQEPSKRHMRAKCRYGAVLRTGSPGDRMNADSRPPSTRMVVSNVLTNSSPSVASSSATHCRAWSPHTHVKPQEHYAHTALPGASGTTDAKWRHTSMPGFSFRMSRKPGLCSSHAHWQGWP